MVEVVCLIVFVLGWRDPHEMHRAMAELGFDCSSPRVRSAIMARARLK